MSGTGVRWAGAGIADQALIALANAGTTLLAAAMFSRQRAAGPILAIAIAYFVIGINRAFVGEVFTALASRLDGEAREDLVRQGLASSAVIGALASAAFVGIWVAWPHQTLNLRDLIWLAPFIPFVLLQDAGRYRYLADRQPARALSIDLIWLATQVVVLVGSLIFIGPRAEWLLIAWGLGGTASAGGFLLRARPAVWRGDPRRWFQATRQLSTWFTATALVAQVQTLAVNLLIPGKLSEPAISGLRTAQTVLLQPVQNFQLAVQGLLVPRLSRLAGSASLPAAHPAPAGPADPDPGAPPVRRDPLRPVGSAAVATLRRQVRQLVLAFTGLAMLQLAVVWPAASITLRNIDKFADIAPLALPISLQAGIYLVQVPFTAALRGMHQARLLFVQYLVFAAVSLTGLIAGATYSGLTAATWGLAAGSATGLCLMVTMYWYSANRLAATCAEPAEVPPAIDPLAADRVVHS